MRRPLRVAVVHVVTGQAEELPRAGVTEDQGHGGAAQVAQVVVVVVVAAAAAGDLLIILRLWEEPGHEGRRARPANAGRTELLNQEKKVEDSSSNSCFSSKIAS